MRVLDTWTCQFVEVDPEKTRFAILSHTWREREQTYDELKIVQARYEDGTIWNDDELSRKIREACRVAREAGYRYLWIDSCCIDKTSSSELSQSINSRWQWYGRAQVCFAHLADVPSDDDPHVAESVFRESLWFTRGWTLQELIAPFNMIFLSDDWNAIGTKVTLIIPIEEVTGIPAEALLHTKSLDDYSVAQRLSWAATLETTRVEDQAYSLLGIFDINMPTLYGEGERAFRRLQEEIVRHVPDQSLFAW
ncbi:HET-domain-containing protein, partial [Dichomitus squalens LYAD-421 SS1]